MTKLTCLSGFGLLFSLLGTPVECQEVGVTALSQPTDVCERGFTKLVGVRELGDGRVILVDEIERLILLLDADLAEGKPIVGTGSGPHEYIVPSHLFPLVGDSSAVLDNPNGRLLILGPDGDPVGVLNFVPGVGSLMESDGQGRFYTQRRIGDSVAVTRWSPSSSALDTVAFFPSLDDRQSTTVGGITMQPAVPPFSARVQWAVAASGRLAIAYPDPYRVEMVIADGVRLKGPVVSVDPLRVSEEHKEEWRGESVRQVTGNRTLSERAALVRAEQPEKWPEYLPPFLRYRGMARIAPDGRLWVQRTTAAGDPPTFDVFDPDGQRIEQVTLPYGRRLVGFGERSVYAVSRDELDLEYLERYILTGGDRPGLRP